MISNRNKIKYSPNKRIRKKGRWIYFIRQLLFWLAFLSFVGVGVWTLIFSPVLSVQRVNVVNGKIDKTAIEKLINQQMQGKYFSVVPKNNLIFLPKSAIENEIRKNFKLVKEINVARVFPQAVLVEITERESKLIWCNSGNCYLVDEKGKAFYKLSPTDEEMNQPELLILQDNSAQDFNNEKKQLNDKLVDFCYNLPIKLKDSKVEIERELQTPSIMSDEVRVKTKDGWQILFNTTVPLETQVSTLGKILAEKIDSAARSQLEYVDLRLKGRVTYKLKNQEENKEESESDGDDAKEQDSPQSDKKT